MCLEPRDQLDDNKDRSRRQRPQKHTSSAVRVRVSVTVTVGVHPITLSVPVRTRAWSNPFAGGQAIVQRSVLPDQSERSSEARALHVLGFIRVNPWPESP